MHDARVFANSSIYMKGENGDLISENKTKNMYDVDIPLVLLGDAAYPLLPWLMKPYSDNGRLSKEKLHFNYRLSRARMVIENAFGRLKGRWRCLLKQNEASLDQMNAIISTCCVLHNICKVHKEKFDDELMHNDENHVRMGAGEERVIAKTRAEKIRETSIRYCNEHEI